MKTEPMYSNGRLLVMAIIVVILLGIAAGCGEIIQSAGHLCNAGGQALTATGNHLTQTVAKEK